MYFLKAEPNRNTISADTFPYKHTFTCIVLYTVDLHGRLSSIVAKTSVLLQKLQTFIAVIHRTPTVVRTQHCKQQVNEKMQMNAEREKQQKKENFNVQVTKLKKIESEKM